VIDEASRAEKGDKTSGVQRQYCGSVGKGENGIVTVYLGYAAGEFHCLLEGDLFLFPNRRRDGLKMPWRDALPRVQTSADGGRQSRPRRSVALHRSAWPSIGKHGATCAAWRDAYRRVQVPWRDALRRVQTSADGGPQSLGPQLHVGLAPSTRCAGRLGRPAISGA